jgi:N-acetylglucosamine-6-phosphate deacetylase
MTRMTQHPEALLGIHLEGPWINQKALGAQPLEGVTAPSAEALSRFLEASGGKIRMVTLAPELAGSAELLEALRQARVVASLGHSLADDADIDAACDRGMTHVTHVFNAMGPMHQREPGVAGLVLADDRLSCDLICDGVHVHPSMVRLAARAKRERLILITDRVEPGASREGAGAQSFGAGPLIDDGQAMRLPDGRLAGSNLTLERALGNARRFGALSELEAVAACTLLPARLLGLEAERGTLRPGARADFAIFDRSGELQQTWLLGAPVVDLRPGARGTARV